MAPAQPGTSSNLLLRKRIDTGRRRSGQLGAVKRAGGGDENAAPLAAHGEACTPSAAPEAPLQQACLPEGGACPAADDREATPTVRFQRLLTDSHTSERWFDDQLTPKADSGRAHLSSRSRRSSGSLVTPHVQSAASQIVDKALKYITSDRQEMPVHDPGHFKFGSSSFLDKGLDAISGVGKLMESFALTLDTVIGQAFEDWGTPKSGTPKSCDRHSAPRPLQLHNGDAASQEQHRMAAPGGPAHDRSSAAAARGPGTGARGTPAVKHFMSRVTDASEEDIAEWHKRAVCLQAELQKLQGQIQENQRLRDEYEKMQRDLQRTATAVSKLEEENSLLKRRSSLSPEPAEEVDSLAAEQVRMQMEALLAEKAKLALDNARLLRENTGLQELLEFTMMTQSHLVGDDELFCDDPSADVWSLPPPSHASTLGDVSPRSIGGIGGASQDDAASALSELTL